MYIIPTSNSVDEVVRDSEPSEFVCKKAESGLRKLYG